MIKSKIFIIFVAVLVIAAAAAIAFWPQGDNNRGWYAWDPIVGQVDHTRISASPKIIDVIEDMYRIVYGDLPARQTAPAGFMQFDSLVEHTADGIIIHGALRSLAGPEISTPVSFTHEEIENMRIITYGLGFTDTFIQIFEDREESVWDVVVAAGNSTWNAHGQSMQGSNLGSEWTINFDALNAFLMSREGSADETFCLIVWGFISNYDALKESLYDAGYTNVRILSIDYYAITSMESFLSVIDALGQLVGVSTEDNGAITDFKDRLFTITNSLAGSETLTVYMELDALGRSPGSGTFAQLCFDVLNLKNINETPGTNIFSRELVVTSEPDVIFFNLGDTRTLNQKMRVTT